MALPKRLYYTLQQAVDELSGSGFKCTIYDLIHYASIEVLEVCAKISSEQYQKLHETRVRNELNRLLSGDVDINKDDGFRKKKINEILHITYNQYGYRVISDFNFDMVESTDLVKTKEGISICFGNFIVQSLIDVRQTYNFDEKIVCDDHDFFEGIFAIEPFRFQDREIDIVNNRIHSIQENIFSIPRYLFQNTEDNDIWSYNVYSIELENVIDIDIEDLIILDIELEKLKVGGEHIPDRNSLKKGIAGRKENTYNEVILDIVKETRKNHPTCSAVSLARKINDLLKNKPNIPTYGTINKLISDNTLVPSDRNLKLKYELVIPEHLQYLQNK